MPRLGYESQLCNSLKDLKAEKEVTGCFGCFSCFFKKKKKDGEELPDYVPPYHNATDPICQCEECFLFRERERNSLGRKLEDCFLEFLEWLGDDGLGDGFARKFLKECQR
ncbi:unnamed protein product [Cylicocyclus nassatus]|uniref:Uncharacterized protein n=1 Tax=Cylicocyclus nassatus TaxID=53992 RepID=A0AA36GZM2_CYLNA|nr:unnamed protein product [Cylicocyclus nassatus]